MRTRPGVISSPLLIPAPRCNRSPKLITSGNADIGAFNGTDSGSSNLVLVTGSGSVWTNNGTIRIGDGTLGKSNQLTIASGGSVFSTGGIIGNNGAGGTSVGSTADSDMCASP